MHPSQRPRIEPVALGIAVTAGLVASLLTGDCAQRARAEEDTVVWDLGDGSTIEVPAEWSGGAMAVIPCESKWDANAVGAAGEIGLLQISPYWHRYRLQRMGLVPADLFDPAANIRVGIVIWEDWGRSWGAWSCKP